jgi:hypothetical protein
MRRPWRVKSPQCMTTLLKDSVDWLSAGLHITASS